MKNVVREVYIVRDTPLRISKYDVRENELWKIYNVDETFGIFENSCISISRVICWFFNEQFKNIETWIFLNFSYISLYNYWRSMNNNGHVY